MLNRFFRTIYPPKCVLCHRLLEKQETDLCRSCRTDQPEFICAKKNISFVADWTALWYYKENARLSLLRYKFHHIRTNADSYGRLLSMRLLSEQFTDFDVLTWVPTGFSKRWIRGFDHVKLIARATGRELGIKPVATLRKCRRNKTQSTIANPSARRANVLGAYKAFKPSRFYGKRVLLLDDIITTGSTISECARVLLTAGAKEVCCAAIAASDYTK